MMKKTLLCEAQYQIALKVLKQIALQKHPYSPKLMKSLAESALEFLATQPQKESFKL